MTTVTLVRHAVHDRLDRILCGRMPGIGLGSQGRSQAAALAERLASTKARTVLTSPLERAITTATPIAAALGCRMEVSDALQEIDFGTWTGRRFDDLASDPDWQAWNRARGSARAPGGESMAEAQARVVALLAGLVERDSGPAILVCHGDIIRAAVLMILAMPLDAIHRFDVDPASISTLELWPGGGKVIGLNEAARLRVGE